MKIVEEKTKFHRFALYCQYSPERVDFFRSLKESFGWKEFSFDVQGSLKRWVFSSSLLVPVIKERFPEVQVDPMIENIVSVEQQWANEMKRKQEDIDRIKAKTDTDFHIKGLKGELYPYQKVCVEFLTASNGRALVADGMGLGKSLESLAYIKYMGFKRTLVVCPASVKFVWQSEVAKWTNLSSIIIDSKTDLSKIDPSINLWVVNYDILKKHFSKLSMIIFDCIIGDESQKIKSLSSIRTKIFRAISRNIPHIILLSGTPLLNRPSELFSLLNILDQKQWNEWYGFARKFCNGHQTRWGFDTSGASNTEELHARIKRYFIRRDKTQVLKELPPKNFIDVPVELDKETAEKYDAAATDLATYLREYAGKESPEINRALAAEKLTQLNVLRYLNAMGKIDMAKELIDSILEAGEKVLVFCSFVKPLEALKEYFGDRSVILTGKTPINERGKLVEAFQNDPNIQVFCGGYYSAGIGITLTAASNVVLLDFDFVPATMNQAIDRAHRPGVKYQSLNIYQLFAKDTIDEDLKDMVNYKQQVFDIVIEGKKITDREKLVDRVISGILERY